MISEEGKVSSDMSEVVKCCELVHVTGGNICHFDIGFPYPKNSDLLKNPVESRLYPAESRLCPEESEKIQKNLEKSRRIRKNQDNFFKNLEVSWRIQKCQIKVGAIPMAKS